MTDTQAPDADPTGGDSPLSTLDLNRTPLGGNPFNLDPPDPANPNLDAGQVLYHMALGARPEDFHPLLQPMAQGYGILLQPQPPMGPGLLGSLDDIRRAVGQAPADAQAQTLDAATANPQGGIGGDQNAPSQDYGDQTYMDDSGASQMHDDEAAGAQRLKDAQDAALANPKYRPSPDSGTSHCNEATYDIAQRTGANTAPLGDGRAYLANTQVRNLEAAAKTPGSGSRKVELNEAQGYANQGRTTVLGWIDPAGGHGHTVTVRADANGLALNPTLAQVGGRNPGNGEYTFRQSFGPSKRGAVGAYVYVGN